MAPLVLGPVLSKWLISHWFWCIHYWTGMVWSCRRTSLILDSIGPGVTVCIRADWRHFVFLWVMFFVASYWSWLVCAIGSTAFFFLFFCFRVGWMSLLLDINFILVMKTNVCFDCIVHNNIVFTSLIVLEIQKKCTNGTSGKQFWSLFCFCYYIMS